MSDNSKPTQNDALNFELTDWLDTTQRLDGAATPGPWEVLEYTNHIKAGDGAPVADPEDAYVTWCQECMGYVLSAANAEWIAHARTALPAAVAALRAVADLHVPITFANGDVVCEECDDLGGGDGDWPCPTIQAIQDTLGET